MARTILVTGGAGFIGSHVCEALLARGDRVVALDNFNDFYDPAIKRRNWSEVLRSGGSRALLATGDIRDAQLVERLFAEHAFDGVVHLAAMAGVRPSLKDPLHYEDVNIRGTLTLLEEVRRRRGLRFVFASSSSVYGDHDQSPFSESHDVRRPVSPYAATKLSGELHCFTYHHLYGVPVSALRFFTVYGPRQRPEMAIHKFVAACHDGKPVPFYGDGQTRRDYTYVDDIVDGVVRALDHCAGYEIYNLGESATTSLSQLVEWIGEAVGRPVPLDRQPMQDGDVRLTCADISKARAKLGYAPSTDVRAGLARFVAWYRAANGSA